MTYELKEGNGTLFQNDRKETERHPDLKGEIRLEGEVWKLSAWRHQTKHGVIYFRLRAERSGDLPQLRSKALLGG